MINKLLVVLCNHLLMQLANQSHSDGFQLLINSVIQQLIHSLDKLFTPKLILKTTKLTNSNNSKWHNKHNMLLVVSLVPVPLVVSLLQLVKSTTFKIQMEAIHKPQLLKLLKQFQMDICQE